MTPRWPFIPLLLRSHVWLYQMSIVSKSHENTSKYVDTVTLFFKHLKQRSLTPRWHLTLHLLRSQVWLYPRIIVSKSHGNTSMYVDTVINFVKYHIHTITTCTDIHYIRILHTEWVITQSLPEQSSGETNIVSFWTKFRRDKKHLMHTLSDDHCATDAQKMQCAVA